MATFIPSQKGGQKLIFEGFLYQKHHRQGANGQMYWKCEQWRSGPCPGYAITDRQNFVTVTKPHNHGPSPNRVELAKIKSGIKQDASSSNLTPRALVNHHLEGISDQAKARLPKLANLEKSVSRKRRADGEHLLLKKHCSIKMVGKKATLKLYYDIISPYSWVAFESLTRYERLLDVHLELLPVSIGFIMKETNNKPNVQQLPQKAIYMPRDLMLVGNYWGIPFRPPKDFFESLVKKASLNPLRFLTALSLYQPEHLRRASREFWLRAWSRDQPVYGVEDVEQVCTKLQIPDCQKLMEACGTEEVKSLLKRRTDEAIRSNAFGLPWIRVERQGQKDLFIWGSDRLPMLCELLGKPFVGPMREQNEIDEETREEKSKI